MYQHSNCEAQHMAKNSTLAITAKSCLSVGPSQAKDAIVEKLVLPVYPCPHHRCCVLFFFFGKPSQCKTCPCHTSTTPATEAQSVPQTLSSHRASTPRPTSRADEQPYQLAKKSTWIYSDWDYRENPIFLPSIPKLHAAWEKLTC